MLFLGYLDFWPTIDLLQPPKATESYRKLLKVNIFQNPQSRIIPPFSPTTASYRKPKVALVMSRSCVQVASAAPRRGKSFDLPYFFAKNLSCAPSFLLFRKKARSRDVGDAIPYDISHIFRLVVEGGSRLPVRCSSNWAVVNLCNHL